MAFNLRSYKSHHNLAALCMSTGDYAGAKGNYLRALDLSPRHLQSAVELLESAMTAGDLVTARQMLEHARVQSRNGVVWAELLGRRAHLSGGPENALEALREVLGRNPQSVAIRIVLARRLIEMGLDDEAAYNFGILERSGIAEGAYALGVLRARHGRLQEALQCFERAREMNPTHAETARQISGLRQMLGLEAPHDTSEQQP